MGLTTSTLTLRRILRIASRGLAVAYAVRRISRRVLPMRRRGRLYSFAEIDAASRRYEQSLFAAEQEFHAAPSVPTFWEASSQRLVTVADLLG